MNRRFVFLVLVAICLGLSSLAAASSPFERFEGCLSAIDEYEDGGEKNAVGAVPRDSGVESAVSRYDAMGRAGIRSEASQFDFPGPEAPFDETYEFEDDEEDGRTIGEPSFYGNITETLSFSPENFGPYEVGFFAKRPRGSFYQLFDMHVFYPIEPNGTFVNDDEEASVCFPAVATLHPNQVFTVDSSSQWADYCRFWASHGIICFYSAERRLQFETPIAGDTRPVAEGLARRMRDIWRNIYFFENFNENSPLYRKVCRKMCLMGYSAGASAAMIMNGLLHEGGEGIECMVPMHPAFDNRLDTYSDLSVPILTGSGIQDVVVPDSVVWGMFEDVSPPVVQVTIKVRRHRAFQSCCFQQHQSDLEGV